MVLILLIKVKYRFQMIKINNFLKNQLEILLNEGFYFSAEEVKVFEV